MIGGRYPAGLNVLTAGYAVCGGDFSGSVINPPYSRLYFILDGALVIKPRGAQGEELRLEKGFIYLLPRGYSFDYLCEGELEHLYFHITMADGGVDIFSMVEEPVWVYRGRERIEELFSLCGCEDGITELLAARRLIYSIELIVNEARISRNRERVLPEAEAAARLIDEAPRIGITLGYLAQRLHISERTLTRKFRLSFGMSIGEYVVDRVMGLAEWDLLYSGLSLTEIGEKYGFCDRFYFSRKFKEYFGVPPARYKERSVL